MNERALECLAARPGRLHEILMALSFDSKIDGPLRSSAAVPQRLSRQLGPELEERLLDATGLERKCLLRQLVVQLYCVARFAQSDGSRDLRNLVAVEQLIKSGRAGLFSGAAPQHKAGLSRVYPIHSRLVTVTRLSMAPRSTAPPELTMTPRPAAGSIDC